MGKRVEYLQKSTNDVYKLKKEISLQKIVNDKTSGSSEILVKLNDYLKNSLANSLQIKASIKQAKEKLSHFEAVNDYLNSIEKIIKSGNPDKLKIFINNFDKQLQSKYEMLYQNAKPLLKNLNTILTLSNSKTLFEVFKLWKKDNKKLKIIICESRPKLEGRNFAEALLKEKIKVEIIYDFMISLYLPKVNAVITGADIILKNGNTINKTGSTTAAILCRHFKKPFYILAAKDKFSKNKIFHLKQENRNEVWEVKRKNLFVSNIYFEEIPAKLITEIITD